MKTYWDSFIYEYKNEILYKSISQILEAFYFYYNKNEDKAKELMTKN